MSSPTRLQQGRAGYPTRTRSSMAGKILQRLNATDEGSKKVKDAKTK
jgi:hypothetical protein